MRTENPKKSSNLSRVQTSLYGYDRSKLIQVNSLRGQPIVVVRPIVREQVFPRAHTIPQRPVFCPTSCGYNSVKIPLELKRPDPTKLTVVDQCFGDELPKSCGNATYSLTQSDTSCETSSFANNAEWYSHYECADATTEKRELKAMLDWYNHLLVLRRVKFNKRSPIIPRAPPPPLSSSMIAASQMKRENPFDRSKDIHPFLLDALERKDVRKSEGNKSSPKFPFCLEPLPPPHIFLDRVRKLFPQNYIEYCYSLTASVCADIGWKLVPVVPPIPPSLDPMPVAKVDMTTSASELSSEGEYSDDGEDVRFERMKRKEKRLIKRLGGK